MHSRKSQRTVSLQLLASALLRPRLARTVKIRYQSFILLGTRAFASRAALYALQPAFLGGWSEGEDVLDNAIVPECTG
jgi:hypothetical protein